MPPVQEISEIVEVRSQESSPLTITPTFPRQFQSSSEGNDTMIPSTAEQCKEFIDRTKQQAGSFLHNNNNNNSIIKNFNNYNNNNNNNDDDDDCWNLTSLDWLMDRNLLRRVISNPDSNRTGGLLSSSPTPSDDGRMGKCNSSCKFIIPKTECLIDQDGFEPLMPEAYHPTRHADCKPPYSFSCLIFMAIENSPEKRLPVKDIYAWIQNNFPFFSRAPSGWKNSVRHNLSLNKCFTKVEKDKGVGIGKGSHWYVDPTYKANLLHALRKTPYQPFHQMQMVSTNHASHGASLSSQETNLKSLFPYVSKKAQGKHSADSNEIDVANALVSLKKSVAHLNKSKQDLQEDGEENYDDGDDWVDEDVDDDEADDDDEETTNAEFVHMLKRKLGQQKVIENFFCTPAISMDHQYGMSDDRVRDILTRFDCFDDCCSLSSMSDDEDGADNDPNKNDSTDPMNDAEIKPEIKEEPLSDDDEIQKQNSNLKAGSKLVNRKSSKPAFGKKAGFIVGIRKPSTKTPTVERAGTKGKRKLATNNNKNEPPNKRSSKEFDEEEQRIREGADALLELATNMINGNAMEEVVAKDSSARDGIAETGSSPELQAKSTRRGRPPAKKKQKSARRKDGSDDETNDFSTSADAKKRIPKDFVPNGLTSVSSTPRSFQSKRLQMRYLEQIVNSNDSTSRSKAAKPQKCSTRSRASTRSNNNPPQDMEVLSMKDWNLNFSSIDLSEINSSDLMKDDGMYDEDGKVLLDRVKEEPVEGMEIKEEVVDDDDDDDGY